MQQKFAWALLKEQGPSNTLSNVYVGAAVRWTSELFYGCFHEIFWWYQITSGITTTLLAPLLHGPTSGQTLALPVSILVWPEVVLVMPEVVLMRQIGSGIAVNLFPGYIKMRRMLQSIIVKPEKKTRRKSQGRSLLNWLAWTIEQSQGDPIGAAWLKQVQIQTLTAAHPDIAQDFETYLKITFNKIID